MSKNDVNINLVFIAEANFSLFTIHFNLLTVQRYGDFSTPTIPLAWHSHTINMVFCPKSPQIPVFFPSHVPM